MIPSISRESGVALKKTIWLLKDIDRPITGWPIE
jgi:hypothetical protein